MTFTVEDGSGVRGANAGVDVAFVTTYLTDRARNTAWDAETSANQQAAIIEATDYVEQRFATRFKGFKEWTDLGQARAVLTFTAQPGDTETITIGTTVYTFNTTIGGAFSVLIGDTIAESLDNLVTAITTDSPDGVVVGLATTEHPDVSAVAFIGLSILVTADNAGADGNAIVSTSTVTGGTWSFVTLNGGNDLTLPQQLSFPRRYVYDAEGYEVLGMPDLYKQALAEYASRALASTLLADPTVDATGRSVIEKMERVGPIVTLTKYEPGSGISNIYGQYPAADKLLSSFLKPTGNVFRG